jgi:hypothetical protein
MGQSHCGYAYKVFGNEPCHFVSGFLIFLALAEEFLDGVCHATLVEADSVLYAEGLVIE